MFGGSATIDSLELLDWDWRSLISVHGGSGCCMFSSPSCSSFWGEDSGDLAVEDGDGGLHFFLEYFFVVLEKLFEDIVDEVTDAAWRPVSGA